MARTGSRYSTYIPKVGMVPALCIGDETEAQAFTKDGTEVIAKFNNFISLRPRLDGGSYLKISNEQTDFGRLVKTLPRFSNVVGLDVTADGEIITLAALMDKVTADTGDFLNGLWDASHGAVDAEDL
jgi:hypothetical protein